MANLIWAIISILFIFWLVGLLMSFGGAFIHIALVVALVLVVYNFMTKGRATL